jgi:non-homologous end joining protein Ku
MDDEPEEIEFDFDKYKDMYQNNAAELIESNIDDDEDEYEES